MRMSRRDGAGVAVDCCVVIVSRLSAANCSHSVEANVRLNVILLSGPDIIAIVRFPEEKRSGVPKPCRIEAGTLHPCPDEGLLGNALGDIYIAKIAIDHTFHVSEFIRKWCTGGTVPQA